MGLVSILSYFIKSADQKYRAKPRKLTNVLFKELKMFNMQHF